MSYHFGNLQWAVAHVASLFGAYFAGVLIYAYSAEKNNTRPTANRSWLVSSSSPHHSICLDMFCSILCMKPACSIVGCSVMMHSGLPDPLFLNAICSAVLMSVYGRTCCAGLTRYCA